jgi:hypothetical protein
MSERPDAIATPSCICMRGPMRQVYTRTLDIHLQGDRETVVCDL